MDAVSTPDLRQVLLLLDKITYHPNILNLNVIVAKRTNERSLRMHSILTAVDRKRKEQAARDAA